MTSGRAGIKNLGEVEQMVMDIIWRRGASTAEAVREAIAGRRALKDSTVRTVLRRLEEKGYLAHSAEGRTYVYRPTQPRDSVAARAVQQIVKRFCGGSVEQLLAGMVEADMLDAKELERLARKIASARESKS